MTSASPEQIQRQQERLRILPTLEKSSPSPSYAQSLLASASIDVALLVGAAALASVVVNVALRNASPLLSPAPLAAFVGAALLALACMRAYGAALRRQRPNDFLRTVGAISFATTVVAVLAPAALTATIPASHAAILWGTAIAVVGLGRDVMLRTAGRLTGQRMAGPRLIVVGSAPNASETVRRLRHEGSAYQVLGLVAADESGTRPSGDDVAFLGTTDTLGEIVARRSVSEVLIAVPPHAYATVGNVVRSAVPAGTTVRLALVSPLEGTRVANFDTVGGIPTLELTLPGLSWQYDSLKRAYDIAFVLATFPFALPVMGIIALAVKLDSPGPILFRQERVGRNGRLFQMYKFRSMRPDAEARLGALLQSNEASGLFFKKRRDPRITRVGRVIRRLSVDELPQLFNVFNGTMSLVGPRPPLPSETRKYEARHLRRLEAVPGLTGLWQVSRGSDPQFEEMVQLDLQYIEEWSLGLDLRILLKTVPAMVVGRGAY